MQSRELDQIQPVDYDDLEKNHEILKTIRGFKSRVEEASLKLDELDVAGSLQVEKCNSESADVDVDGAYKCRAESQTAFINISNKKTSSRRSRIAM